MLTKIDFKKQNFVRLLLSVNVFKIFLESGEKKL